MDMGEHVCVSVLMMMTMSRVPFSEKKRRPVHDHGLYLPVLQYNRDVDIFTNLLKTWQCCQHCHAYTQESYHPCVPT